MRCYIAKACNNRVVFLFSITLLWIAFHITAYKEFINTYNNVMTAHGTVCIFSITIHFFDI